MAWHVSACEMKYQRRGENTKALAQSKPAGGVMAENREKAGGGDENGEENGGGEKRRNSSVMAK